MAGSTVCFVYAHACVSVFTVEAKDVQHKIQLETIKELCFIDQTDNFPFLEDLLEITAFYRSFLKMNAQRTFLRAKVLIACDIVSMNVVQEYERLLHPLCLTVLSAMKP